MGTQYESRPLCATSRALSPVPLLTYLGISISQSPLQDLLAGPSVGCTRLPAQFAVRPKYFRRKYFIWYGLLQSTPLHIQG